MESNAKMVATDSNILMANVATTDTFVSDDVMLDKGSMGGISSGVVVTGSKGDYAGGMDTPKAGMSTQVILYIVIGVCAAVGIALGIIRGIKVAKK